MASKGKAVSSTSPGKRKKKSLSMAVKLEVIEAQERGVSRAQLMAKYDLKKSTLHDILKSKERVRKVMKKIEGGKKGKDVFRSRKLQHDNLDDALYKWYKQERAEGVPLRGIDIQHAAQRVATHLGIEDFKCSDGWLWRFKRRHGIVKRAITGELLSADVGAVEPCFADVGECRVKGHPVVDDDEGTPNQDQDATPSISVSSTRKRKLLVPSEQEKSGVPVMDQEYVLMEKSYLQSVISELSCGNCFGKVNVSFVGKDLDCRINVWCEDCGEVNNSEVSDTPVTKTMVYSREHRNPDRQERGPDKEEEEEGMKVKQEPEDDHSAYTTVSLTTSR